MNLLESSMRTYNSTRRTLSMARKNFNIALFAGLGLYCAPADSFAQCACAKVDPPLQGYSYWCCDGSYTAPTNSGNGYYMCNDDPSVYASGQTDKGQCCVADLGDSCGSASSLKNK